MDLTIKEILLEATTILKEANIPSPAKEATLLLQHYLQKDQLYIMTNQDVVVKNTQSYFDLIKRRAKNEPLEYITNRVSFYSQEFYIDSGALIPRPETELLIDEVLQNIPNKEQKLTIVEVGVGSGIISIMLAKHLKNAKFIAIDISPKALAVAKKNIAQFNLEKQIELRECSLLDCVDEKIDYLVSNPPYIEDGVELESNLSYEPQNALFGGRVGDEIIKQLLDEVLSRKIKFFSCEMGYDQKSKISSYLEESLFDSLTFYKDWSGFDRGFTLKV